MRTQHDYYRAARDRMRRVEEHFEVAVNERVDSTSTLGGRRRRISVNQIVYVLLGAMCVADLIGLTVIVTQR
ncbi:MAG: hypothetical protein WKF73_01145 [Nocardioidaceae bacterium]